MPSTSSATIDTSLNMRNQSIIKQIKCPSVAKVKYHTSISDMSDSSLNFVFGKVLPEALGYTVGYNISGLGANEDSLWGARAGFEAAKDAKWRQDRVLGYNYFFPTGKKCGGSNACKGKPKYMYVRNYPVNTPKGNLTFAMLEDIYDLNPIGVIKGLLGFGGNKCVSQTLPVGSGMDMYAAKNHASKAEFVKFYNACIRRCDNMKTGVDNCRKDCFRGWWEETHCTEQPAAVENVQYETRDGSYKTYAIPSPTGRKPKESFRGGRVRSRDETKSHGGHIALLALLLAALIGIACIRSSGSRPRR